MKNIPRRNGEHRLSTLYAYQAYTVLEGAKGAGLYPRYRFLWDERGAEQTSWAKKPTLLAELGRLGDAKKIRDVAKVLCEYQPSTTVAVTVIRAVRVGRRALWSPTRILDRVERELEGASLKGQSRKQRLRFIASILVASPGD